MLLNNLKRRPINNNLISNQKVFEMEESNEKEQINNTNHSIIESPNNKDPLNNKINGK